MMKFYLTILIMLLNFNAQAMSPQGYSYSDIYIYDNQDHQGNTESTTSSTIKDPFIAINKHIFNINYIIDAGILRPIAETYLYVVPQRGRNHVSNFMRNIGEPVTFINLILQGKFAQARISLGRFLTNSTLGCVGIMDVAADMKLKYQGEDFGQTLGHHKVPSGPYLVAPILGPTSVRDLTGKVADFFLDPFKYALKRKDRNVISATYILQKRSDANDFIKTINNSLDPYETAKTLYIQNRATQINN